MLKRKFLQCTSLVNRDAIKRETIDGIEHIIVSSFTLPENVVMNGIMYPAEEINNSFEGLNRTLAPVEHPTNAQGDFVSASDPEAIHNFYAGAFNDNAVKVGNRIHLDKIINVPEAMKTDRGKRLLDRLNELETSDKPRPIHTSTGIFLEVEMLDEPQTNADGDEFKMIARNMVFDHDAILLDSVGAATPNQGVGMAVNKNGEKLDVEIINLDIKDSRVNKEHQSFSELEQAIRDALERSAIDGFIFFEELFDDHVIFHTESGLFSVPFSSDETGRVTITGIPLPVERKVTFIPKTNSKEVNAMKDMILNALKAKGVDTEGMDDDALFGAYNKMMTKQNADDGADNEDDDPNIRRIDNSSRVLAQLDDGVIETAVANAMKPLMEKVTLLEGQISASSDAEKSKSIQAIVASSKYPDMGEEDLMPLSADKLKSMAANCGSGFGLPLNTNTDADTKNSAPADMPE